MFFASRLNYCNLLCRKQCLKPNWRLKLMQNALGLLIFLQHLAEVQHLWRAYDINTQISVLTDS